MESKLKVTFLSDDKNDDVCFVLDLCPEFDCIVLAHWNSSTGWICRSESTILCS